jgi:dsRNA-specific ribonuclease
MVDSETDGKQEETDNTAALQKTLGHCFANTDYFYRAITHPSYTNEHPEEKV